MNAAACRTVVFRHFSLVPLAVLCVYYAQETPCFHYILFILEVVLLPNFRCQSANKVGVKKILFVLIAALEKNDVLSAVQESLLNNTHHFLISSIVNFRDLIRISS